MECLEFVKKRLADVVAVDPEDMYVAYHLDNEDFDVISEIRTVEEKHALFRYDGIILVRKGSDIHSIKDLKGKKSCHTGFGRNVGYKIPLTKLRKGGALKLSNDPELSSSEKELEALSNFFEKSCIVGNYSPDKVVDSVLSKLISFLQWDLHGLKSRFLQRSGTRTCAPCVRNLSSATTPTITQATMALCVAWSMEVEMWPSPRPTSSRNILE